MSPSIVNPFLDFTIKLIIRGKSLDFDLISYILNLEPSSRYKWDGSPCDEVFDAWYYIKKSIDIKQLELISNEFFNEIAKINTVRKIMKEKIETEICLHIHSEMAQIYVDLPKNMLNSLSKLEIPFSISILSWGMVELGEDEVDSRMQVLNSMADSPKSVDAIYNILKLAELEVTKEQITKTINELLAEELICIYDEEEDDGPWYEITEKGRSVLEAFDWDDYLGGEDE